MDKIHKKLKQTYIKSTISPDAYMPNRFDERLGDATSDDHSLLILPKNKKYQNIIDIRSQILTITPAELLKNRVLIQAIENYSLKTDNKVEHMTTEDHAECWETKRPRCWTSRADQLKILRLFFILKQTRQEISNDLMIPYSTVSRCIRNFNQDERFIAHLFKPKKVDLMKCSPARKLVIKYTSEQMSPFSSTDIQKYIEVSGKIHVSQQSILKFLKKGLCMTYRRVSSRPVYKDPCFIRMMQLVFCVEYLNIAAPDLIIVNIDETLFSNNTKFNYSWGPKGQPNYCSNISFRGSMSVIGAITNRGDWYFTNLIQNNCSKIFIQYLESLMKWMREDLEVEPERILLLLDNSPIHTSKECMEHLNSCGCRVMLLPPYSPQFAPIELLFGTLKRRLQINCKNQVIKLNTEEGFSNIRECLCVTSKEEIISFWIQTVRHISELVL